MVEDLASKQAGGNGEGQIAVTEDELKELNHQVSIKTNSMIIHNHPSSISAFLSRGKFFG